MVRDVELSFEDIVTACVSSLEATDYPDVEARARDVVSDATAVAVQYPAGTVLRVKYYRDRQQWLYIDDDD